jgi:AcrR family transcriptional regulator
MAILESVPAGEDDEDGGAAVPRARLPRPRHRRAEIVQVAAQLFNEKGYEHTSMQDIADAVGILKGSLYYYIESKEDLLYEITREVHQSAYVDVDRLRAVPGTALSRIRALVTAHLIHNIGRLVKMAVFFHDFRALTAEHRAEILRERDRYESFLRELIIEGQAEGVICPDVDAKVISFGILGLVNWIYHWYDPRGDLRPAQLADAYADFIVAGLQCDPATHHPGHRTAIGALPFATLSELGLIQVGEVGSSDS